MALLKKKKTMAVMPNAGNGMKDNMKINPLSPTQTAELASMVADNVGAVMATKRPKFSKKKKIV